MIIIKCIFCLFFCLANFLYADDDYKLENRLCVSVEGSNRPILLSDILKVAHEKNITNIQAKDVLLRKQALFLYAKNELKFSMDFKKAALEHAKKIMADNKLTQKQFEKILSLPPYTTTFDDYIEETAYLMLYQQIKSHFLAQSEITKETIEKAKSAYVDKLSKKLELIFVSIPIINKNEVLARNIGNKLTANNFKELQKIYEKEHQVSFAKYEAGSLDKKYDKYINNMKNSLVTEMFKEGDFINMIIKCNSFSNRHLPLAQSVVDDIVEKLKNDSVEQKVAIIADETLSQALILNNCNL